MEDDPDSSFSLLTSAAPPPYPFSTSSGAEDVVVTAEGSSSIDDGNDSDSDDSGIKTLNLTLLIDPSPHISSQFFTFTRSSHSLMVRCLLAGRIASPVEICGHTPLSVLGSWRSVWKDRNEDTAYITGWKRIQEKLSAHIDDAGNEILYFKNNSHQYVSHCEQWQEIVMRFHADGDFKHLGLKETIDRIKQVWTVGAKFYGIPETFIRVCVASCPICSDASSSNAAKSKRRRFEYTESFEVSSKDVPLRLQQLAAKHKVVLCIRQKYIRYKPFMAEVKDYACHRAGDPNSKKARVLKKENHASKRCGCGFRIRAIVPIKDYNEKEKTFVYDEEGMAIFKLYAVHSGHEPEPADGSARRIHRSVGVKDDNFGFFIGDGDVSSSRLSVLQQVQDLQSEIASLECKVAKMPNELLCSLPQDLSVMVDRLRSIGEGQVGFMMEKDDRMLVGDHTSGLAGDWEEQDCPSHMPGDGELIEEDDEDAFDRSLSGVTQWDGLATSCCQDKDLLEENIKPDKWLESVKEACEGFNEKSLVPEDLKPLRHGGSVVGDPGLAGIQVDVFYSDNPKWYDSPSTLDRIGGCGDAL